MNTTAAATTAGVTLDTIRTWCRRGVITAVKRAGRWIIDATSLAHRIALATLKPRKEATTMQPGEHTDYPLDDTTVIRVTRDTWTPPGQDAYYTAHVHDTRWGALPTGSADGFTPDEAHRKSLDALRAARAQQARIDYLTDAGVLGDATLAPITGSKTTACHYCGLNPRTCDCR